MNYDGLLAQLTDDKLVLFENVGSNGSVEEGAILEEQAATIQTVPRTKANASYEYVQTDGPTTSLNTGINAANVSVAANSLASTATITTSTSTTGVNNTAVTMTPQRKISTSSRFMNAFTQFYNNATSTSVINEHEDVETNSVNPTVSRTPTKGMESKLMSMWHNVKYGWSGKIRTNFSKEQPVWLLGRCYHRKNTPPMSMENSTELVLTTPTGSGTVSAAAALELDNNYCDSSSPVQTPHQPYHLQQQQQQQLSFIPNQSSLYPQLSFIDEIIVPQELGMDAVENQVAENPWEEGIEGFKRDFCSRIWMTYRREFPTMNGSNYTSDCGWGCMLRSGQMLLAQGLICHFLGRSWRYDPEIQLNSTFEDNMHRKIIKWFGDNSSKSSPFSIHALVHLGQALGKKAGDWYGPSSVSHLLRRALQNAALENADFDNISIYVARDCTIYIQDVEDLCRIPEPTSKINVPWQASRQPKTPSKSDKQYWKSLILLIPLRLGTEKLNSVYVHCLKLLLSSEYCIGIIGGRPKHSLYFVGFQEDRLIHLDPHYCQEMVDVNQENFPLHSFHCKSPRKLKTSKMDPSCCVGFYCQTKADFDNFVESVQLYLHPMRCASGTIDRILPASMQMPNATATQPTTTITATTNGGGHNQFADITYPLFSFSRGRCMENERDEMSDSLYKPLQKQLDENEYMQNSNINLMSTTTNPYDDDDGDGETEEFVLL